MYKNNWFYWSYNSIPYSLKNNETVPINFSIDLTDIPSADFKQELLNTIEHLNVKSLFFTGHPTNYAILKICKEINRPLKVYIPKYDQFNLEHCFRASNICEQNNLRYTFIDINLESFFKNDALRIFDQTHLLDVKKLPLIYSIEKIDEPVVCCIRDPILIRDSFYSNDENKWFLKITEDDVSIPSYFYNTEKMVDFFFYRKELVISYLKHQHITGLIKENGQDLNSSLPVLVKIYNDLWSGFAQDIDSTKDNHNTPAPFIDKFFNTYIRNKIQHSKPLMSLITDRSFLQ